jgi:hypothetical protein
VQGLEEGKVFSRRELTSVYHANVEARLPELV